MALFACCGKLGGGVWRVVRLVVVVVMTADAGGRRVGKPGTVAGSAVACQREVETGKIVVTRVSCGLPSGVGRVAVGTGRGDSDPIVIGIVG